MRRGILLAGVVLLLALALVPPIVPAEKEEASVSLNASVEPGYFNASIRIVVPVNSSSLESLDGYGRLVFESGTLRGNYSATGYSPLLENTAGTASVSGSLESGYSPDSGAIISKSVQSLLANLTLYGNNTELYVHLNATNSQNTTYNPGMGSGSTTRHYEGSLEVSSPNGTSLSVYVNGSEESVATPSEVSGTGDASGSVSLSQAGQTTKVDFSAVYSYTVNTSTGLVVLNATVDLTASDYLTAYQIYVAITQIVELLNLSSYVTVEPPSLLNPTVRVIVNYQGTVNVTLSPVLGGGLEGLAPENVTLLLPANATSERVNVTATYQAVSTINMGNFTVNATIEGGVEPAPSVAPNVTVEAWTYYEDNLSAVVVELSLEIESPCAHYTGFVLAKELASALRESENVSFAGLLSGSGVSFLVGGEEEGSVDLGNASLSDVAMVYEGLIYYSPSKAAIATGENVSLPIALGGLELNGTSIIRARLPYAARLLGNLSIEAEGAEVTLENGSLISGSLVFGVAGPENVSVPLENATVAGYAVTIANVSGMLDLRLELSSVPANATLALYVEHDNGTTELIKNVGVEDGYLVARVAAGSTYIPVALSATGGGGGGENTTTSSPETTTKTTPGATLAPPTTSPTTTTTSPATTSPTTSPPAGATTSPTGTSPTPTTTSPAQTATGTTPGTGGGGRGGLVAAAIVVIIIVAAAAYALTRR